MKNKTKIALGVLGAAAVANGVHAAVFRPEKKEKVVLEDEKFDADRAAKHISRAIQIKTVSNSDYDKVDWDEFKRFHEFLNEEYPLVTAKLEKEVVSRASLLYRWRGKNPELEPMALLSHMDVVPVAEGTEKDWIHPPFSGYIDGEFIWGRGAMDMKNHLVCVMEAVETLLEEGFEPERDVYLCFGHDEEVVASPDSGAGTIAHLLLDRGIHLDSVIDEGGAILPVRVKGVFDGYLAGVGIAEKGYADFEITVDSKGGHSSQPPKHSGLGELADVIKKLENNQFKSEMMPFMKELLEKFARNVSFPARLVTCNIKALYPLLEVVMKQIPPAASLLRTTTGVTMAQGSPAANVLPQRSSIVVNFRAMPGSTTQDIEKHIAKVLKHKKFTLKRIRAKEPSRFSPTDSRAFKVIEEITNGCRPNAVVAPYLVMGGTDASFYEIVCENVYRYSPFVADTSLLLCTHGTNERLPVKSVGEAVGFFKRYVRKLASE